MNNRSRAWARSGAVDVAQLLGGDPRRAHLPVGIAGGQPGEQPGVAAQGVALGAAQQHPPDPVHRVSAPAPVPEGVLLDAAAHCVDRVLAQLHGVERSRTTVAAGNPARSAVS